MSSPSRRFFDQYSVFCVFGSVLGCVVVPIVSQIIKTQSMECVILSAIVLSFTAAHLKTSKRSTDGQNTKIIIKDSEKRRVVHPTRKKHLAKEHQQRHDDELEYIQQFEHLKVQELERKQEDKKLKKSKKREEQLRLRNANADNKSAQPSCSVKTRKQKKEEERPVNSNKKVEQAPLPYYPHTMTTIQDQLKDPLLNNIDQKCIPERRQSISAATNTTIPRFEQQRRQRFLSEPKPPPQQQVTPQKAKPQQQRRASGASGAAITVPLTIKCNANLSGSCSSLSSLSSSSSSDASFSPFLHSPPPSSAAANSTTTSPWKLPVQNLSTTPLWMPGQEPPSQLPSHAAATASSSATRRFGQVDECRTAAALSCTKSRKASSSLFCEPATAVMISCHDPVSVLLDACGQSRGGYGGATAGGDEPEVCGAEYSLFGPPRFSCALGRATAN